MVSTVVKTEVDSVVESVVEEVVVEEVEELVVEVEVDVEVELSVVLVVKVDSIPSAVMVVSIGSVTFVVETSLSVVNGEVSVTGR